MEDPIEETKKIDQKTATPTRAILLAKQEAEKAQKALQQGEVAGRTVTTTPTPQSDKSTE